MKFSFNILAVLKQKGVMLDIMVDQFPNPGCTFSGAFLSRIKEISTHFNDPLLEVHERQANTL